MRRYIAAIFAGALLCATSCSNMSEPEFPQFKYKAPVEKIEIANGSETTLVEGNTLQLTHKITPYNAANPTVFWKTDNGNVAMVSQTGLVTAVGPGTATITVMAQDDDAQATFKVAVTARP